MDRLNSHAAPANADRKWARSQFRHSAMAVPLAP